METIAELPRNTVFGRFLSFSPSYERLIASRCVTAPHLLIFRVTLCRWSILSRLMESISSWNSKPGLSSVNPNKAISLRTKAANIYLVRHHSITRHCLSDPHSNMGGSGDTTNNIIDSPHFLSLSHAIFFPFSA
jgi:hypothetical protein